MRPTLEVFLPAPKALISQRFGENANGSYARDGLKGHTAYDWAMQWGDPVYNCVADAYCYSNMHENDPVLMNYRAVFFLVETGDGKIYEISYGHLSRHLAIVGKTYQPGEIIGLVGNTGDCFADQLEVTEAEKRAGSHAGAHLHGSQIRPVKKVTKRTKPSDWYLKDAKGYLKKDGFYFETLEYDNGFNGCVSQKTFSTETLATSWKAPAAPVSDIPAELEPVIEQGVLTAEKAVQAAISMREPQRSAWLEIVGTFLTNLVKALGGYKT